MQVCSFLNFFSELQESNFVLPCNAPILCCHFVFAFCVPILCSRCALATGFYITGTLVLKGLMLWARIWVTSSSSPTSTACGRSVHHNVRVVIKYRKDGSQTSPVTFRNHGSEKTEDNCSTQHCHQTLTPVTFFMANLQGRKESKKQTIYPARYLMWPMGATFVINKALVVFLVLKPKRIYSNWNSHFPKTLSMN